MGAVAAHYTPDLASAVHNSRHFESCLPLYDLYVTTKRYELEVYRAREANDVMFPWQGSDNRFVEETACGRLAHRPPDVVFVGHMEAHYVALLSRVRSVTKKVCVHGPGWENIAKQEIFWRGIASGPVWGSGLPSALARGRIGLGLLSKRYPDAFTTRSFEVPAAATMLLGERTPDHLELFEEDREAVFFADEEELCDKLQFYLDNEAAGLKIAKAARARVLSNYHWKHVLAPVVQRISELKHG
ncbi:MAG: glycosyltransferase family 1 protein [Chloroflexi bacterium]|nr:MAG: glycosyltransferase family 1 protein [Chloroflexota bacterium]